MESAVEQTTQSRPDDPWYNTLVSCATVGAVFSITFAALLVINFVRTRVLLPRQEERLVAMKQRLVADPTNEQLLDEVRQYDLGIRQKRVRGWAFSRKCSYLLCASLVVLVAAGKWAVARSKERPRPALDEGQSEAQLRQAALGRWMVTVGMVLMVAAGTFLTLGAPIEFPDPKQAAPPWPSAEEIAANWHRFRGPGGAGATSDPNIPTSWDGPGERNILWKSNVPLPGFNSPIVWEDRVFLSGADPNGRQVYCFDAGTGELLWVGDVPTAPLGEGEEIEIMEDTGLAASTCATDGRRVYAIFATGDVAAFDFSGRQAWYKNLGLPDSAYGYATSLEVYQNRLIVQYDQGGSDDNLSRLYAFDGPTGRVVWEKKRPVPNSWTSPALVMVEGRPQLLTVGDPWVIAYDPNSGQEIWRADCVAGDVAPSPIYTGGLAIAIEPYAQIVAVDADGTGDVTETHIKWRNEDLGPDICCPVGDSTYLYVLLTEGMLSCHSLKDGAIVYEQDMEDDFFASPSLVGDKLYLLAESGTMHIVQVGGQFKALAKCELGEKCHASPAFANGRIYIRTEENLYCVADEGSSGPSTADEGESDPNGTN